MFFSKDKYYKVVQELSNSLFSSFEDNVYNVIQACLTSQIPMCQDFRHISSTQSRAQYFIKSIFEMFLKYR